MNRKPHSLDITCSYQLSNRKTKKKLGTSKFEGYINIEDGKTYIRLPMRSYVKVFLDKLHDILAGEITNHYHESSTASIPAHTIGSNAASLGRKVGIILGTGITPVGLTQTDLVAPNTNASICAMKSTTFQAPTSLNATTLKCKISRLFSNASSDPWTIYEAGLKTHKVASTASNAGNLLMTRDYIKGGIVFAPTTDKLVDIEFRVNTSVTTGGAVLNLMRLFYNLFLKGSTNDSSFLPRSGSLTASYGRGDANFATNAFVVDGAATKLWGVVLGRDRADEDINEEISPDEFKINSIKTDLTYGANTITAVTISGTKAYFTVSRDITNGTTSAYAFNRIGLLTKGATADPSTLQNDQVFLMINRIGEDEQPSTFQTLAVNQTIRVDYTFEISI